MTIIVLQSIVSTTLKSYILETIHHIVIKKRNNLSAPFNKSNSEIEIYNSIIQ